MLERLGCDDHEMLSAARDKLGSDTDVENVLKQNGNEESKERMIVAFYCEPVFQIGKLFEVDRLNDSEVYVDLDNNPTEEVDNYLDECIKIAVANGLLGKETV